MEIGQRKEKPQHVVYYRSGDMTRVLDRKDMEGEDLKVAYLLGKLLEGLAVRFPLNVCYRWGVACNWLNEEEDWRRKSE